MKNKKNNQTKGGIYIAVCCLAVLAAAIGYVGRSNTDSSQTKPKDNENTEIVSKNTSPELDVSNNNLDNDIEITVKDYEPISKEEETENIKETVEVSKATEIEEQKFLMPVEGTVVCAFSDNELIYNKLLSDWRTHNGIDISCDENSAIYASADGIVSEVLDNSMGKSVKIDHQNGYVSVYSNLSEEIEVKSGDEISSGALIGKVSDTNTSDFTNGYHLHFEILFGNEYVDPAELLAQ